MELKKGLLFIISILGLYTLFWHLIQFIGLGHLRSFTAWTASELLELSGVTNTVITYNSFPVITIAIESIRGIEEVIGGAVTDLCVGDIELALLPAIILSTFDRSIRKRVVGVISGILLIIFINPLRIFVVMWTGANFGWGIAEFMHSFTFRLTLILIILGFYYIWYLKYEKISEKIKSISMSISKKINEIKEKMNAL